MNDRMTLSVSCVVGNFEAGRVVLNQNDSRFEQAFRALHARCRSFVPSSVSTLWTLPTHWQWTEDKNK